MTREYTDMSGSTTHGTHGPLESASGDSTQVTWELLSPGRSDHLLPCTLLVISLQTGSCPLTYFFFTGLHTAEKKNLSAMASLVAQ